MVLSQATIFRLVVGYLSAVVGFLSLFSAFSSFFGEMFVSCCFLLFGLFRFCPNEKQQQKLVLCEFIERSLVALSHLNVWPKSKVRRRSSLCDITSFYFKWLMSFRPFAIGFWSLLMTATVVVVLVVVVGMHLYLGPLYKISVSISVLKFWKILFWCLFRTTNFSRLYVSDWLIVCRRAYDCALG